MTPDRSALDLIRASITAHEAKADEARDAGRYRISTDHHAIAAGLRIAEAHILANPDAELDASQRRAVRIQQLLDDTRDRSRKDAAASRESERQLQQQIDRQANEIDRLRDQLAALHEGEEEPTFIALSGPTVATWLWSWNRATPAQRLERAALIIDAGQRAGLCFQMAHESTIQRLRADQAAIARVRTELDAIQAKAQFMNPYDRDPDAELERIRAALEAPKETPDA